MVIFLGDGLVFFYPHYANIPKNIPKNIAILGIDWHWVYIHSSPMMSPYLRPMNFSMITIIFNSGHPLVN